MGDVLSIWIYIWYVAAYNKAIVINYQQDRKDPPKETYLTGFFFGYVVGMNLGVYWHLHSMENHQFLFPLSSPIFNGLILGFITGFIGHFIERYNKKRRKISTFN